MKAWQAARAAAAARKAKPTACRECGAVTITGPAGVTGIPAACDPTPLTWAAELTINIAQRRATFAIIGGELERREPFGLTHESRYPVVPRHECGNPIPAAWVKPIPATRTRKGDNGSDAPNF